MTDETKNSIAEDMVRAIRILRREANGDATVNGGWSSAPWPPPGEKVVRLSPVEWQVRLEDLYDDDGR